MTVDDHAQPLPAGCPWLVDARWCKRLHAGFLARGMGRYERVVEPIKRELFADLAGDVLEIGPGVGSNLRFMNGRVRWIGIEPNAYCHDDLRASAERHGVHAQIRKGVAEALPLPDASVDAVVSSLVLCSVRDLGRAVVEIGRVLKPGGRFVFVEHVAAPPGTWTRFMQRAARPVWRVCGDGCEPDRETWSSIRDGNFSRVLIKNFRVPYPIVGPHIAGRAVK